MESKKMRPQNLERLVFTIIGGKSIRSMIRADDDFEGKCDTTASEYRYQA